MHFTISGPDIRRALGVSAQTIVRWFKNHDEGHPLHVTRNKVIFYRLDDVVARIRKARPRGLYGDELLALAQLDAGRRFEESADDMYVGEDVGPLAFLLTNDESERLPECAVAFRHTAVACGFSPDLYLHKLLLHPGIVRYVLTDDDSEIPTLAGWPSWTRAFCVVNVPSNLNKAA